jgi:hypothetical protein
LGDELPLDEAPYVIERDRINEGRLPGFNRKLLPVQMDRASGRRSAGGYYLLDTPQQAKFMFDWYQDPVNGFVLDGIPILQRAYFKQPRAHWWHVIGAHDFKPLESAQKVVRFERWRGGGRDAQAQLPALWPQMRTMAEKAGLTSVWLLFNPDQDERFGLISVADRVDTGAAEEPDFTSVDRLAGLATPGAVLEQALGASRSFDRTSWVFSIWFPYRERLTSRRTLWPNSPPFPGL